MPTTGSAYIGLSRVLYEWNDLDEAIEHVTRGITLGEQSVNLLTVLTSCILLARQNLGRGKTKAMMEALHQAEEIPPKFVSDHASLNSSAWKARLSLIQSDLNAANRWAASQEDRVNLHNVPDCWSEMAYLVLVRLRIAQGEVDEIPSLLERLRQKAEGEKRTGGIIEILALESMALQVQGETDQVLTVLERALSLANLEGYVRTFVDEGEPIARLLRLAAYRSITPEYVTKLLAAFGKTAPSLRRSSAPPLIEHFTDREMEILQLVETGLSNKGIAEALFLAEGTVKRYIYNIYGKLNVEKRIQVVARAREPGLL